MTEEKKSLFDKAIGALTDRDEKDAESARAKSMADAAKKEAEARAKIAADKAAADKSAAEKEAAAQKSAAPKKGIVTVRSLRVRADHNTTAEVVAGLVDGNEVTILDTWTDGKDTWVKLENGWAAMIYDSETYIKPA